MQELSYRARRILYATIAEYIATGEPVGSRRLSKRYGINLSPATIRNVLADLEDAGFLAQPHTSAGRVPTDAGFRLFVDALVQMREVTREDRALVLRRLENLAPGADLLREASSILSTLTGAAAVVTAPPPDDERLAQLRFMPLRERQLLAVLVTRGGAIQNRVVPLDADVAPPARERINNMLAELVESGALSLRAVHDALAARIEDERGTVAELRAQARDMVDATAQAASSGGDLVIDQGRLFDRPEFLDADKIRRYLRAFDDREHLLALLESTLGAGGVSVLIGSEVSLGTVDDVSVISSRYERDVQSAGTVAVIGPTRMDYAKVVPLVGYTAQVMSRVLREEPERDGNSSS
ncbi:MAG: heat-inducible transcriptional repressor HrcA [Myxococcota bacterium]